MAFFFELERGCFGCSIRTTVNVGLLHYMLHGLFVMLFAFTNTCYPPFYYPDFMYGGAGAALLVFSFITTFFSNSEKLQWLRCTLGFILTVVVFLTVISTYIYTFERWNDVISTALTKSVRKPLERDFPDYFWFTLVVLSCIFSSILLIYLLYIVSYLCNKCTYPNEVFPPGVIPPAGSAAAPLTDPYSSKNYKPYPTQPSSTK